MARNVNKLLNDQEVLLMVGPFLGLDTNTSPMFVAPNNATFQQNVALNQQYGAYTVVPGRTGAYTGTAFPAHIFALGVTPYMVTSGVVRYVPGIYAFTGTFSAINAYFAGYSQAPVAITGWAVNSAAVGIAYSIQDSKVLFAGNYVIPDLPMAQPQIIIGSSNTFGNTARNWGIAAPTVAIAGIAGGAAGNLNGSYSYSCTFVNTSVTPNIESGGAPFISVLVSVTNQQINLNTIPVSTDPQVNQRNIYRIGGTIGGTPLLVGNIPDNITTTYSDNLADTSVTGQQLILRQDPAPAGGWAAVALHKGRVWGFGTTLPTPGKSDLWYSNYLLYTSFNSVTQVLDCDSTLDDLPVALASLDSVLVAFKQKSFWLCYGDTQNDFITRRTMSIGCVSKGSVAVGYGKVFWLSADGIYMFDGNSTPVNISDGNIPTGSIRNIVATLINTPNQNILGNDVGVRGWVANRTYYFSMYSLSGSYPNVTYAYDLTIGAWSLLPYSTYAVGVCGSSYFNPVVNGTNGIVGSPIVLGANTNVTGQVDQWFSSTSDLGNLITASWTTQITDSGEYGLTKQYRYIEVIAPNQPNSVQVTLTVNPGVNEQTFGPYSVNLSTGSPRFRISLPANAVGYNCQLVLTTTSSDTVTIYKAAVLGYIKRVESPPPWGG